MSIEGISSNEYFDEDSCRLTLQEDCQHKANQSIQLLDEIIEYSESEQCMNEKRIDEIAQFSANILNDNFNQLCRKERILGKDLYETFQAKDFEAHEKTSLEESKLFDQKLYSYLSIEKPKIFEKEKVEL